MWSAAIGIGAALLLSLATARADIPQQKIKVGIVDSGIGPIAERTARGAVAAAQIAAEDFEAEPGKVDVEIHESYGNDPGHDAEIVRDWLDREHIAAVIDVVGSAAGVAIADLMRQHDRTFIVTDLGGPGLARAVCGPSTVQWSADPAALGESLHRVLDARGDKGWFFLAGQGPLQQALVSDTTRIVSQAGGRVLGAIDHPIGTHDFAPDLGKADSSGAGVIALAEAGPDFANAVTEAAWLGLPARHVMAALYAEIEAVDQIGLHAAQGLIVTTPFYWNRNAASREFRHRFAAATGGRMPTENEAGVYSAMIALLHTARAANSIDAGKVIAELRRQPIPDQLLGAITVRSDGMAMHDMYVFRVKSPAQSSGEWDDYDPMATVPAAQAFSATLARGCPVH